MKFTKKKHVLLVMLLGVAALFCVVVLSGCALTSAHAVNAENTGNSSFPNELQNTLAKQANGKNITFSEIGAGICSDYVDANNDGICDNCRDGLRNKNVCDGSDPNGSCGGCIDANNDGICDYYNTYSEGGAYCDKKGFCVQNTGRHQNRLHHGKAHE